MKEILKIIFAFLFAIAFVCITSAQTNAADSLKQLLANEKDLTKQFDLNRQIQRELLIKGKPDQSLQYINRLFTIAGQLNNDSLLMLSYFAKRTYCDYKTDSKEEIECTLKALAIAEKKFPRSIPRAYLGLGSAYIDVHDYDLALSYLRNALSIIQNKRLGQDSVINAIHAQLAIAFDFLEKPDSILHYEQLVNEFLIKHPYHEFEKSMFCHTANAYSQLGNFKLAESFYQNSIDEDTSSKSVVDAAAAGGYARFY